MSLAEKIERVLHFAGEPTDFCPETLESDVGVIKNRYSELKLMNSFDEAARIARAEYINMELVKSWDEIHEYRDRLEENN